MYSKNFNQITHRKICNGGQKKKKYIYILNNIFTLLILREIGISCAKGTKKLRLSFFFFKSGFDSINFAKNTYKYLKVR